MKTLKVTLFFALLFGLAFAGKKDGHQINFKVNGLANANILIAYHMQGKHFIQDTLTTNDKGIAYLKGEEKITPGVYLAVFPTLGNTYFEFIISEQFFDVETDKSDIVGKLSFTNSKENEVFYADMKYMTEQQKLIKSLSSEWEQLPDGKEKEAKADKIRAQQKQVADARIKISEDNPDLFYGKVLNVMRVVDIPDFKDAENENQARYDYYKAHYFDFIDFTEPGILRTPVFHNKLMEYFDKTIPQQPDSLIKACDFVLSKAEANYDVFQYTLTNLLNKYAASKIMCMDKIYVHLVLEYYKKGKATWTGEEQLAKIIERGEALAPIACGEISPALCLNDTTVNHYECLERINADYTVLYVYDPNCGHCKKATPKLVEFYNKFGNDFDIEVYAISTVVYEEKQMKEWKDFIKKNKMNFINVADLFNNRGFRSKYDLSSTPQVFVLDTEKRIIAKRMDVEQLENFFRNYWKSFDRTRYDKIIELHGEEAPKALPKGHNEHDGHNH